MQWLKLAIPGQRFELYISDNLASTNWTYVPYLITDVTGNTNDGFVLTWETNSTIGKDGIDYFLLPIGAKTNNLFIRTKRIY